MKIKFTDLYKLIKNKKKIFKKINELIKSSKFVGCVVLKVLERYNSLNLLRLLTMLFKSCEILTLNITLKQRT